MTRIAGIVASPSAIEARADGMRLQRVDPVAIGLVALGVGALLLDDPIERVPSLDPHARGRGERRSRDEGSELDELLGRDVYRSQRRARSHELDVAAHPHGLPPRAEDLPRRRLDADEAGERLLPLIAPDLQVDVDDVVVRDRHPAERVRDGERARLVAGVEVPDDPRRVAAPLDAERPGLAGLEARLVAARERDAALGDRRVHERLAFTQRDVAVPEEEVAREADLEPLAYPERAVRLNVDRDVGLEQREAVGVRRAGKRERRQENEEADEDSIRPRPRSGRLQGCSRDRKLRASGFPVLRTQKATAGASRCASSSTSKNSRIEKPNGPARTRPGNVCTVLLYVSTVSL